MILYWQQFHDRLLIALLQHLKLVGISLSLALVTAFLLIALFSHKPKSLTFLVYFFSTVYAVPSYAFFALVIPFSGLGTTTAVLVLGLYSEYILLRSFVTGIQQIDPLLIEVAEGMGMSGKQILRKVQLPLATRAIYNGIRLTLTSMIGIATIAATINAGGIGTILFDGLRTQSMVKIMWGALLTIILCLGSSFCLKGMEHLTLKKIGMEES